MGVDTLLTPGTLADGEARRSTRMKRALIVNDCGLFFPSGMVRALQFQPLFGCSESWQAAFTSRHSESLTRFAYDRRLWAKAIRKGFRYPLKAYTSWWEQKREDEIVTRAAGYDLVAMIKSPGTPLYRRLRALRRPRLVMDINDAVWTRQFAWPGLQELLREVDGVICENDCVAEYARQFNTRVFVIPDAPQVEMFDRYRGEVTRKDDRIVIGWIGGSNNIGPLYRILEPLEALFARYPQIHLRIVGASESVLPKFEQVRFSCRPSFDQNEMVREVLSFHIGLFPLFHNEDGRARGTLKAKIYMSGEAVAVCENYGENPNLVRDGVDGLLASSQEEWYEKIKYLILNHIERAAMARRGLEKVRQHFTADKVFSELTSAYDRILL
jgi:glycosyltransferase involved in cell wall biosynthesis